MNKILLPLVCLGLLTACESVPANRSVTMQSINTTDLRRASYDNFVTQRTQELQQMGGAFKKNGAARLKALEEAKARFGEVPADETTLWAWGKNANRTKQQAELNDQLNKMARNKRAE